jgi:RES domain-containing protein
VNATHVSHIRRYFERYTIEVDDALRFLEWLQNQTFDLGKPTIEWEQPAYRIVYGDLNPLSIAGSLAAGGRFNIGGAQANHFFSQLPMEAALYAASSIECAQKEAGAPLGNARFFSLHPHHPLQLWDLHSIICNHLHYQDLETHVNASPLAAIWKYQKVPKLSQLLGSFLRKKGGDGLVYPSTKEPTGTVLSFFARDDASMHRLFRTEEILHMSVS